MRVLKLQTLTRLMAIMLVLGFTAVDGVAQSAASKTQLTNKLGSVEKKKKDLQREIRVKTLEAKNVTGQLLKVEQDLEIKQTSLAKNKIKLMNAESDLRRTNERLERTRRELKRRQDLLERRVVNIYEGEDVQYVNVVLGSVNMWTFLTRAYYLQAILDSDTKLIARIQTDKQQIEADQKRQAERVAQIQTLQTQLEEERNAIQERFADKAAKLDEIENSKDLLEQVLRELEAESRRIESQIRAYQSTAVGQQWAAKKFVGGLLMPVNGRLTSKFGYRTHPITGVYKLHTGVDFACSTGTPIQCAADGIVISAGWMGAYGNAVIVDHGGGVSTLYGHCSRLATKSGAKVKRGEVIGYVGSTGYSTGPHLHFEKRVNGTPVNPF